MLTIPSSDLVSPRTPVDAARARRDHPGSLYLAGGTDLLVNLKHKLHAPTLLVNVLQVEGLAGVHLRSDGALHLGATTRLHEVAQSALVAQQAPGLAEAVGSIAGPQHRHMGTLGGNVLLDTRCLFYNQTEAWRSAIGFCLKKDGVHCHVSGSPKGCVAAQSSDSVPMLTALGAWVELVDADGGQHQVRLSELFGKDGRYDRVHQVPAGALLTGIVVPPPAPGTRSTYRKVRSRAAVDYPQLGVAVRLVLDVGRIQALDIVIGAMLPAPRVVGPLDEFVGQRLDATVIDAIAARVVKTTRPMPSVHGDPSWRRHMAGVETRRALISLIPG